MVLSEVSTMSAQSLCEVPCCLSRGVNYSSLQQAVKALEKLMGEEMTGVDAHKHADTHLWLKMAIVCSNCCDSLTCIIPPPTSFNQHIYMSARIEIRWHTHAHNTTHTTHTLTYVHKHSRLLVVVMVFCSTLRCNGPRHCSVRAISLL